MGLVLELEEEEKKERSKKSLPGRSERNHKNPRRGS
jgi:hypothetical protein